MALSLPNIAIPRPRPARPEARPQLRVIPGGAARKRSTGMFVLGSGTVIFLMLAAVLLVVHVRMSQDSFTLADLEASVATQAERLEELRVAVAELESPDRVLALAQGTLGMTSAEDAEYLYVVPDAAPAAGPDTSVEPTPAGT